MAISLKTVLFLLPLFHVGVLAVSGTGKTTRYWDCCKPSCSWTGKATLKSTTPVLACDKNDNPITTNVDLSKNACDSGGTAYMCTNESPWAISDTLSYGFAAVNIAGGTEATWCCACYQLNFTSTAVAGKQMIVQATNTGGDLGTNQFDITMPGGGFGIFDGCTSEFGTPSTGWGAQYGGVSSRAGCDAYPQKLKAGCYWHWDWYQGADNPTVTFQSVACPSALTNKSGCIRADDTPTGAATVPTYSATASVGGVSTGGTTTPTGTSSTGGTAAKYGQCGGTGWTGPTQCEAGSTCQVSSPYYSQCL